VSSDGFEIWVVTREHAHRTLKAGTKPREGSEYLVQAEGVNGRDRKVALIAGL